MKLQRARSWGWMIGVCVWACLTGACASSPVTTRPNGAPSVPSVLLRGPTTLAQLRAILLEQGVRVSCFADPSLLVDSVGQVPIHELPLLIWSQTGAVVYQEQDRWSIYPEGTALPMLTGDGVQVLDGLAAGVERLRARQLAGRHVYRVELEAVALEADVELAARIATAGAHAGYTLATVAGVEGSELNYQDGSTYYYQQTTSTGVGQAQNFVTGLQAIDSGLQVHVKVHPLPSVYELKGHIEISTANGVQSKTVKSVDINLNTSLNEWTEVVRLNSADLRAILRPAGLSASAARYALRVRVVFVR